ncbi:MAG: FlgD ig protein, partial [Bacteroidetes bacterium]|nr:FlgD ig protein [Bacteroidota bacterium]
TNWEGALDPGTTAMLPATNWEGSRFVLFLVPPGFDAPGFGSQPPLVLGAPLPDYIVSPANVCTKFPGGKYIEGPTYAYYYIPGPPPGRWLAHLEGDNTGTPNGEKILFHLVADANVTMDVRLASSTYNPGDLVTIRAVLTKGGGVPGEEHTTFDPSAGEPITDATVIAQITRPGATTPDTLSFVQGESGTYIGTYSNTNFPGTYDFKVLAQVPNPALPGMTFLRESQQSFFVIPSNTPSPIVILATDRVTFIDQSRIVSGHVVVNQRLTTPNPQLSVGPGVNIPAASILAANTIGVAAGAAVAGDAYFNTLTGTITGTPHQGLNEFPLVFMPGFQYGQPTTNPSGDVNVPNGSTNMTLAPGTYRDIVLSPHSTLTLTGGGVYHIRDLWLKSDSRLLCSGASDVRILGGFAADNRSEMGPSPSTPGVTAKDVIFYVGATDLQSRFSLAVTISPNAIVNANIYAKNGTILLNQETQSTGAFIAKNVVVGRQASVSLNSAFNGVLPLFTGSLPKQGIGVSSNDKIPTTFVLYQNYPNPFNPTTQIQYGLPKQSNVKLTIHNLLGQEVARLVEGEQEAGFHEVQWSGRNANGTAVASGVYLYRIHARDFVKTSKMLFLK